MNIFEKIYDYFEDRCWFVFHEWYNTQESPGLTPNTENYYWTVQKCMNCPAKRTVMTMYAGDQT